MTVLHASLDPEALTLTIVSEFDAPPQRVWQVWADPRQLERWWGPPGYPATVVDHDLAVGGQVTYYMTGAAGDKHHGRWRVNAVETGRLLRFDDGCVDDTGAPSDEMPTISTEVLLTSVLPGKTRMTMVSRFASIEDMEQMLARGTDEGMKLAVGQIDAVLADRTES
jgi:uncharacterized protein YndB with AHSA1/START domain